MKPHATKRFMIKSNIHLIGLFSVFFTLMVAGEFTGLALMRLAQLWEEKVPADKP